LEIDPNDADAWNNKGNALYNLGNYNEAIECYDQALKIDPKNVLVIENRDIVLERMEKEPDHHR
jgi:tetratricopeptide (TPR) repeat protein